MLGGNWQKIRQCVLIRDVVLGTCTCTRVVLEYHLKVLVLVLVLVLEGKVLVDM